MASSLQEVENKLLERIDALADKIAGAELGEAERIVAMIDQLSTSLDRLHSTRGLV